MQRWTIKKVWIPLKVALRHQYALSNASDSGYVCNVDYEYSPEERFHWDLDSYPIPETDEAWETCQSLAADGYELVAALPHIAGHELDGLDKHGGSSFTTGYLLFFKRPIE